MPSQECQGQAAMIGLAHRERTRHAHLRGSSESGIQSQATYLHSLHCAGVADLPETQIISSSPTKVTVRMHRRQTIQRIPACLPTGPQERSFSPSGSWRTLSVESKSASTSSGYGTPCAVHGESYCRHTSIPCSSTSFEYLTKNGSNLGCDIVLEDTKLDSAIGYKKQSHNASEQRSGDMYNQRLCDNVSPLRRLKSQRKLNVDQARLYDVVYEPRTQQSRQYHPVYRLNQQQYSQNNRSSCSFCRDHYNQSYNYYDPRNSPYFPSIISVPNTSWRENDGDYSPCRVVRLPPPIYPTPSRWKSESDLRVRTLDEEATEIYNELVDTADMLALMEQKTRESEAQLRNVGMEPPPVSQRPKSCYDLPTLMPAKECKEQVTPRLFPKPLDNRRRQRRANRQCTPTNMTPQCVPRKSRFGYQFESSMDALMADRDEESALAALEEALNLDFQKPTPSRFANGGGKSGPTRKIRAHLYETEDGWVEQQACYASPGNHSCIEIDSDNDDTEKLELEMLLPVEMVTGTLGQGSGSYSEFTASEDISCPSDLEI
ncbi:hypothetical protein TSMEX_001077 [Taenia solium]|eukprot:TsM_000588300 transcript=TsM_000588300 gene=TsM_000588300